MSSTMASVMFSCICTLFFSAHMWKTILESLHIPGLCQDPGCRIQDPGSRNLWGEEPPTSSSTPCWLPSFPTLPWWENLHYGNWQMLQFRALLSTSSKAFIKHLFHSDVFALWKHYFRRLSLLLRRCLWLQRPMVDREGQEGNHRMASGWL